MTGFAVSFSGTRVVQAHTLCATAAFTSALALGIYLHYFKIVQNGIAGWPDEWWPSVSATIGDWYPERNIFQILIALTSGPRFALLFCWWLISRPHAGRTADVIAFIGVVRTVSCGGWVYISSTDDHDIHDILMITYVVLTLPWMIGCVACSPPGASDSRRQRKWIAISFFATLVPMIYFFIRHKVQRIPGAYTYYSFFEWYLIFADVAFDSRNVLDFRNITISITNVGVDSKVDRDTLKPIPAEPVPVDMAQAAILTNQSLADKKTGLDSVKALQNGPASVVPSPQFSAEINTRSAVAFISEVYLAYVFWSIFTSLAITLFYFSVWELAISGSEIALLSTLSPIILTITPLYRFATSHTGRVVFILLSLSGLAAYKVDNPLHRLFVVSFANIVQAAGYAAHVSVTPIDSASGLALGLGIILSVVLKLANHANLPTWPIVNERTGGWNQLGITLALLALTEVYLRPEAHDVSTVKGTAAPTPHRTSRIGFILSSSGLGALIFAIHSLLADSGTLIAWSWTGYPLTGPTPLPHGVLVIIAMCVGLGLSATRIGGKLACHPLWLLFGSGSCFFLYRYRDWPGFTGSLGFAVFVMSLLPSFVQEASAYSPGSMWFVAWLVNNLLDLAHVWVVAYAFVPGGVYLREATYMVLIAMMLLLANGMYGILPSNQRLLLLQRPLYNLTRYSLLGLALLALGVTFYRMPSSPPQPHRAGDRIVTAGIWTVHFGIDLEGRDSQRRMRDLIGGMELDVLGLLETDLHRVVYGNRDLTQVIAQDLGYYVDLGPGPQQHTWGAALLSKYPIINSTHHLLPSPHGELAPAISATLDVYGTNVHIVVSHNGQEEDALDRELQSKELGKIMSAWYPNPTIFLGYVVTKPKAERPAPYKYLVEDGKMTDIDEGDWDRWCEYILYRGLWRIGYARVSRSTVTDTELQVGKFLLPRHGTAIQEVPREDRYLRVASQSVPASWRFPAKYEGSGTNGHFYHVFDGPQYFSPPSHALL